MCIRDRHRRLSIRDGVSVRGHVGWVATVRPTGGPHRLAQPRLRSRGTSRPPTTGTADPAERPRDAPLPGDIRSVTCVNGVTGVHKLSLIHISEPTRPY